VLVCVDLQNHAIEIVTGNFASTLVDDQACKLAAVSMANAFANSDFVGGLIQGFAVLGSHAYKPKSLTDF
jgi:uncharacterized membrane protein YgcG